MSFLYTYISIIQNICSIQQRSHCVLLCFHFSLICVTFTYMRFKQIKSGLRRLGAKLKGSKYMECAKPDWLVLHYWRS